jgi:molybdopterin synthase catalytic subunit
MKVIHIAGFSNSGKTTFISALLPALEKLGKVGVIKHIGHHGYSLPDGKDTSRFFASGAAVSAGIDTRKSVLLLQENDLERVLDILCDAGMQFAVVEGFKEKPYRKVVIGNVPGASNVILQDPSVQDVLEHLSEFSDRVTPEGISKELQNGCPAGKTILVTTIALQGSSGKEQINDLRGHLDDKIREIGDVSIRLEYSENAETGGPQKFMIGVCSPDPMVAMEAALIAADLLLPFITQGRDVMQ